MVSNAELGPPGRRKPRKDWANPALGEAFESCSPPRNNGHADEDPEGSRLPKGAIAGIAIGSVAGSLLLFLAFVAPKPGRLFLEFHLRRWFIDWWQHIAGKLKPPETTLAAGTNINMPIR